MAVPKQLVRSGIYRDGWQVVCGDAQRAGEEYLRPRSSRTTQSLAKVQ